MKYILVYGSLRKGAYNYDRFKAYFEDEFQYVTTLKIEGFDLYALPYGYPGIKRNSIENNILIVDIIKVSDECFDEIEAMEIHSGYHTVKIDVVDIEHGNSYNCTLFVYDGPVEKSQLVKNGDWINHLIKN